MGVLAPVVPIVSAVATGITTAANVVQGVRAIRNRKSESQVTERQVSPMQYSDNAEDALARGLSWHLSNLAIRSPSVANTRKAAIEASLRSGDDQDATS